MSKVVLVAFTLSMPGRSSWDGKWSGDGECYILVRRVGLTSGAMLHGQSYSYAWSDGWCASVDARIVDHREAAKLRRKSRGFCGYDWMVDSLLVDGRILSSAGRRAERARLMAEELRKTDDEVANDPRA